MFDAKKYYGKNDVFTLVAEQEQQCLYRTLTPKVMCQFVFFEMHENKVLTNCIEEIISL